MMPTKPLRFVTLCLVLITGLCLSAQALTIPAVSEGTLDLVDHTVFWPSTEKPFLMSYDLADGHGCAAFTFAIPAEYENIDIEIYRVLLRPEIGFFTMVARGTNDPIISYGLYTAYPDIAFWDVTAPAGDPIEFSASVTDVFDTAKSQGFSHVGFLILNLGDSYNVGETASRYLTWDGAHGPQLLVLPEPSGLLALLPALLLTFHRKRV